MKPKQKYRWIIAITIGIFIFLALYFTVDDIGLTWDEPAYIAASNSYITWFRIAAHYPSTAFSSEMIAKYWSINSEHPPLDKVWTGIWWQVSKNFTNDLTAHRFGNMLLASILASLLYLWISDHHGWIAGVASVAALFTMPRFFFHAHLSSLDVPAAVSVFVVTYLFWKTLEKKHWTWGLLLGLVWGLALATKINAIFVPFTLGIWWLIFSRKLKLLLRLVIMGITAIPVFLVTWPWFFTKTIEHLGSYIAFVTVNHWKIGQFFLGKFYLPPPWYFGFVMVWAVVPLAITLLYLLGFGANLRGKTDKGLGWLFMLSALTPILAIALSKSVVYDNDRMFMVSFPFLAGLAGIGFNWLVGKIRVWTANSKRRFLLPITIAGLVLLVFSSQVVSMIRLYPHFLSYYGEGVGGVAGANKLGLETTYWCETYKLALPILNEQAKPNDKVWVDPWSHDVLIYYQTQGLLRKDLVIINEYTVPSILGPDAPSAYGMSMELADWFLFENRESTMGVLQHANPMYKIVRRQTPVMTYSFNDVPIFTLYKAEN